MTLTNFTLTESEFGQTSPKIVITCTSTADAVYQDILPVVGGWQSQGGVAATYSVPKTFAQFQQSVGGGFPNFAGLFCLNAKIKTHLGTDSNATGYHYVDVDFEFGELQQWTQGGICQSAMITMDLASEGIPIPTGGGILKWASGVNSGNALDPNDDIQPQLWLPYLSIEVNFPFKPTLPIATFLDDDPAVSSADVVIAGITIPAGLLIFQGLQTAPSTSCDGSFGWSRNLKFGARSVDWNKVYSTADFSFQSVNHPLYPTADLNSLFTS